MVLLPSLFGIIIMSLPKFFSFDGTSDGWLGYWGGIIGSVLGVVGAIIVLNRQLKHDLKQKQQEQNEREKEFMEEQTSREEQTRLQQNLKNLFYINQLKINEYSQMINVSNDMINDWNETINYIQLSFIKLDGKKWSAKKNNSIQIPDNFDETILRDKSDLIFNKLNAIHTVITIYDKEEIPSDLIEAMTQISNQKLLRPFVNVYRDSYNSTSKTELDNNIKQYKKIYKSILDYRDMLYQINFYLLRRKAKIIDSLKV